MAQEAGRIIFSEALRDGIPRDVMAMIEVFPNEHVASVFDMHAEPLKKDCMALDCGLSTEYYETYVEPVCGNETCPCPELKEQLIESIGATISTCLVTVQAGEERAVVIRGRAAKLAKSATEPARMEAAALRREADEILAPALERERAIKSLAERDIHRDNFDAIEEVRTRLRASLGMGNE